MLADGRVRRIAAVPNHYRLGWRANGMTVWDVEDDAIAGHLGPRAGTLLQAYPHGRMARYDDGSVGQGVRADGHHDEDVQGGIDDGPAAGQRVCRGSGGAGHDEAIAAVGVHVAPVDVGLEVEDAPGFPLGEHDVVQGELAAVFPAR